MAECRLTESNFYVLPSDVNGIADLLDCNTPSDDRSVDKIHSFIDKQRRKNTVKSTKRDLNILTDYFFGRGEFRLIENIPSQELDVLLSNFYIDTRKKDGNEYEPGSLHSIKCSLNRYLRDHDRDYSVKDRVFSLLNRTVDAKRVSLRKAGNGQKPNAARAVAEKEEILIWEKRQLGDKSPKVL